MAENSKIQWTTHTHNPWRGCTKVSAGCTHCYAETLSKRNPGVLGIWGDGGTRVAASEATLRAPFKWDREAGEAGDRRRVFCASLADVFEDRPELVAPRARLWQTILGTPNLDWLLLTKRPENVVPALKAVWDYQKSRLFDDGCLAAWIDGAVPPDNVWLGTSVEDQSAADLRVPLLLATPAKVRFLSMEPLLWSVDLSRWLGFRHEDEVGVENPDQSLPRGQGVPLHDPWVRGPDWVIVGGESGGKSRPCHQGWVRSVVAQCKAAGVPVFVKQMGANSQVWTLPGHGPVVEESRGWNRHFKDQHGGDPAEWDQSLNVREFPEFRATEVQPR